MTVTDAARKANYPALDTATAKSLGYEIVRVIDLPESQKLPAQRRMISKEAVVVKTNDDGFILVRYGQTSAWCRPEHVKKIEPA